MTTKTMAANTAKAIAWDQFLGYLDRLIFYPLLGYLALHHGWFICFVVTLPCYYIYSIAIVTFNFRSIHENGVDIFGIHTLREVAMSTKPPVLNVCRWIKHVVHHYCLVEEALMDHCFDIASHIISRFVEKIGRKILAAILSSKFLLYGVGTVVVLDPQSVFMFTTQKCKSENEFMKKIVNRLFPMVSWHIFCWSGFAALATKGFTLLWEL
jgi:hypothetical protein